MRQGRKLDSPHERGEGFEPVQLTRKDTTMVDSMFDGEMRIGRFELGKYGSGEWMRFELFCSNHRDTTVVHKRNYTYPMQAAFLYTLPVL